jgi:hypothetical protein
MYGFLKIGKNEKQVRWRETVQLTPSDANSISDEGAYFEIHYNNRDFAGVRPVSPFANEILYRGSLVSRQENQLLDPLEIKPITTTVHLVLMPGKLEINIDADDSNQEARENNNGPFWITLDFRDFDRGR